MALKGFFRKILLTAVLAAASLSLVRAQSDLFIDGLRSYQQGNNEDAIGFLEKEIGQNPSNDAAYYYLYTLFTTKNIAKAEGYLKKAVELDPDNYWYKYSLAVFYSHTDRNELTIRLLEELLDRYPKKNELYLDAANIYISQNETDKALETLDRIERIRGKNETIALTRLELLSKKPGANEDSIYTGLQDYFKECKTPRLATILGDYHLRSYRDSAALAYYNEALSMDENYSPAWYGKAQISQINRKYGQFFSEISHVIKDPVIHTAVKAEYLRQLTENPQFVRTFSTDIDSLMIIANETHPQDTVLSPLMSGYYFGTGRAFLSAELLKRCADRYPESFNQSFQHLVLLYYAKTWNALEEYSTAYLLRFPGNRDIIQMRAIAFSQRGDIDAAIEDYQSILAQNPRDTTVLLGTYANLGDLYHQKGDSRTAYKMYRKALKINPKENAVLNNYAYFLCLEGKDLKKARQMSKITVESEPDNPTYLDTYAWILHLMGDNTEAKALFKHAMLYGGKDNPEILRHYAEVLNALGEKDLAKIYFNQAKAAEL